MTNKDYFICGCTALLDAIGQTLTRIIHVHENLNEDEQPGKTLFIITTDGMENSSKEYSYKKIKELINLAKEKYNYEFIFLGANIESEEEASKLGIDCDNAVTYKNDSEGIKLNYCALDEAITNVRLGEKLNKTWRKNIDRDVKRRGK